MKKTMVVAASLLMVIGFMAGCGSSGSSSSDTPNITTVDSLPRATSPVVSGTSGSISAKDVSLEKASAVTGVNLKNMSSSTFGRTSSMDLCQAANQTKQVIENAAMADMILCNIQTIVANDTTGQLATIYDGNYHVFGLSASGGDGETPDHVKAKITKTGDVVTGFEMFACKSGTQKEYINQAITGTGVTITSKGKHGSASNGWYGRHQIEVTGVLNSSGYFTSKSMELDQYGGQAEGAATQWSEATVTQYADKMVFDGYDSGSPPTGGTYQNRVYAQYQLIDSNSSATNSLYDIGLIAVGNGAAHGFFNSTPVSGTPWTAEYTAGWNGDTLLADNTVTVGSTTTLWYDLVTSTSPRNVSATAPSIEFTTSQTYACNETEEVQITANETALNTACSRFTFGHTWVDCYNVIQPSQ